MFENLNKAFLRAQFGFKKRARLYRKLSKFLSNDYALSGALDEMHGYAQQGGRKSKLDALVLDDLRKSVANGFGLSPALKEWVPNSERMIIEGGEKSGKLPLALERVIQVSGTAKAIRNTLIAGLTYPIMLIALAIGFMVMFGTMVIPAFEEVLPRSQWTGVGAQMGVLSDFVRGYLGPVLVILAVAGVGVRYSIPRWKKGLRVKFDNYVPYSIYRTIQGAGFMLTLSGMLESGITLVAALEILAKEAAPYYKERLERTLHLINSGNTLGDALYLTGYNFPDRESINDLRSYSKIANVEEALAILANEWLTETVEKIQAQTAAMKNMSFIFLGLTFAWMMMGIFSIQQQIANAV